MPDDLPNPKAFMTQQPPDQPMVIVPAPDAARNMAGGWRERYHIRDPLAAMALDESAAVEARFIAQFAERSRQANEAAEAAYRAAAISNTERHAAEQLTEGELRYALLEAILAHSNATLKVEICESNLSRAKARMEAADAELSDYNTLDDEIAEFHVDQIKANRTDPLPFELSDAQRQRGKIVDALNAARTAHDKLQDELKAAQSALDTAAANRAKAAIHVLTKHTDAIAAELEPTIARMLALREQLASMASVWVQPASGPLPLSSRARRALNLHIDQPKAAKEMQAATRDLFQRLLVDADSTMEG